MLDEDEIDLEFELQSAIDAAHEKNLQETTISPQRRDIAHASDDPGLSPEGRTNECPGYTSPQIQDLEKRILEARDRKAYDSAAELGIALRRNEREQGQLMVACAGGRFILLWMCRDTNTFLCRKVLQLEVSPRFRKRTDLCSSNLFRRRTQLKNFCPNAL